MKRLPSIGSLRLLVEAGRAGNLSHAARSLGMTQSIASRRIAALEADLGIALLTRHRRGVELTAEGRDYLAKIAPALDVIARATETLRTATGAGPLKIRVYSTFAARWLLPRLPDFHERHPEIEVRMDTTVTPVMFGRDDVDCAIQFGTADWPGTITHLLIADRIEPVCTPHFAERHGLGGAPRSLHGIRLVDSHYRRADWRDWAAATGCALKGATFMRFPNSMLAYQAAIEGIGMAMGQTHLLTAELRDGSLVAPFGRPVMRDAGYYLVAPKRPESPPALAFRRWLERQVA